MADFKVNHITGKQGQQGTVLAGVTTMSSTGSMRIPSGPTEQRGGRGRGIVAGGRDATPAYLKSMEYIEISTTGNATSFGDLSEIKINLCGASSSTRGVVIGGQISPGNYATKGIEYVIISSGGGASDFGDLRSPYFSTNSAGVTSNIRGFACGALNVPGQLYGNAIDYITIASLGDMSNWGELSHTGRQLNAGCESTTRGIIGGGYGGKTPSDNSVVDTIQYITFASQGNSEFFGSLSSTRRNINAVSDKTRGVFIAGYDGSNTLNTIDYITMETTGNAVDFGDTTTVILNGASVQNTTRGVYMGGQTPTYVNTIQYITIQSTGNASDFGDLITANGNVPAGLCDINGGF